VSASVSLKTTLLYVARNRHVLDRPWPIHPKTS